MEALLSPEMELCLRLCSVSKRENQSCNAKIFSWLRNFNRCASVVQPREIVKKFRQQNVLGTAAEQRLTGRNRAPIGLLVSAEQN